MKEVWVFNGARSRFASGIFTERNIAEAWIIKHQLSGILTCYPLNVGVYEWAIENNFFEPQKDAEQTPAFIQRFTSASQQHDHYENGVSES